MLFRAAAVVEVLVRRVRGHRLDQQRRELLPTVDCLHRIEHLLDRRADHATDAVHADLRRAQKTSALDARPHVVARSPLLLPLGQLAATLHHGLHEVGGDHHRHVRHQRDSRAEVAVVHLVRHLVEDRLLEAVDERLEVRHQHEARVVEVDRPVGRIRPQNRAVDPLVHRHLDHVRRLGRVLFRRAQRLVLIGGDRELAVDHGEPRRVDAQLSKPACAVLTGRNGVLHDERHRCLRSSDPHGRVVLLHEVPAEERVVDLAPRVAHHPLRVELPDGVREHRVVDGPHQLGQIVALVALRVLLEPGGNLLDPARERAPRIADAAARDHDAHRVHDRREDHQRQQANVLVHDHVAHDPAHAGIERVAQRAVHAAHVIARHVELLFRGSLGLRAVEQFGQSIARVVEPARPLSAPSRLRDVRLDNTEVVALNERLGVLRRDEAQLALLEVRHTGHQELTRDLAAVERDETLRNALGSTGLQLPAADVLVEHALEVVHVLRDEVRVPHARVVVDAVRRLHVDARFDHVLAQVLEERAQRLAFRASSTDCARLHRDHHLTDLVLAHAADDLGELLKEASAFDARGRDEPVVFARSRVELLHLVGQLGECGNAGVAQPLMPHHRDRLGEVQQFARDALHRLDQARTLRSLRHFEHGVAVADVLRVFAAVEIFEDALGVLVVGPHAQHTLEHLPHTLQDALRLRVAERQLASSPELEHVGGTLLGVNELRPRSRLVLEQLVELLLHVVARSGLDQHARDAVLVRPAELVNHRVQRLVPRLTERVVEPDFVREVDQAGAAERLDELARVVHVLDLRDHAITDEARNLCDRSALLLGRHLLNRVRLPAEASEVDVVAHVLLAPVRELVPHRLLERRHTHVHITVEPRHLHERRFRRMVASHDVDQHRLLASLDFLAVHVPQRADDFAVTHHVVVLRRLVEVRDLRPLRRNDERRDLRVVLLAELVRQQRVRVQRSQLLLRRLHRQIGREVEVMDLHVRVTVDRALRRVRERAGQREVPRVGERNDHVGRVLMRLQRVVRVHLHEVRGPVDARTLAAQHLIEKLVGQLLRRHQLVAAERLAKRLQHGAQHLEQLVAQPALFGVPAIQAVGEELLHRHANRLAALAMAGVRHGHRALDLCTQLLLKLSAFDQLGDLTAVLGPHRHVRQHPRHFRRDRLRQVGVDGLVDQVDRFGGRHTRDRVLVDPHAVDLHHVDQHCGDGADVRANEVHRVHDHLRASQRDTRAHRRLRVARQGLGLNLHELERRGQAQRHTVATDRIDIEQKLVEHRHSPLRAGVLQRMNFSDQVCFADDRRVVVVDDFARRHRLRVSTLPTHGATAKLDELSERGVPFRQTERFAQQPNERLPCVRERLAEVLLDGAARRDSLKPLAEADVRESFGQELSDLSHPVRGEHPRIVFTDVLHKVEQRLRQLLVAQRSGDGGRMDALVQHRPKDHLVGHVRRYFDGVVERAIHAQRTVRLT